MTIDKIYFPTHRLNLRHIQAFLLGLLLLLILVFPTISQAQDVPTSETSVQEQISITKEQKPNAVVLGGKTLFEIETSLDTISSEVRAENVSENLIRVANDLTIPVESIRVETIQDEIVIVAGEDRVIDLLFVSQDDAKAANQSREALANSYVQKIQTAITEYRQERSIDKIVLAIIYTVIATIIFFILLNLLNKLYTSTTNQVKTKRNAFFRNNRFQKIRSSPIAPFIELLLKFLDLGYKILYWAFIFFYIFLVLGFFPWTKPISQNFWSIIFSSISTIEKAIVGYLPNLFMLFFIGFMTKETIGFLNFFFQEVKRGRISIPWLYDDWIKPTSQLLSALIVAIALAMALPFFPGFKTAAFQGVSVVIGALFTLGATGAISNIVGGVIAVYTRAFQIGDLIKIGEFTGVVAAKDLLVTRIRTPKNVVITIPNSTVLASNIINYTELARYTNDNTGLILHTTITLGYDVPWKK
ncbi:MAG: mechanosensitive ion channel, partial [Cyanobacteriota bacterium]|nr:mechanosensitive ion channel [Cyanobacteriota bacterium]